MAHLYQQDESFHDSYINYKSGSNFLNNAEEISKSPTNYYDLVPRRMESN